MKQDIVPAEALKKEFYSFDVSNKEKEWILNHTMMQQYIVVTHGTQGKDEFLRDHPELSKTKNKTRITKKTRFGYCTWCHQSFILPDTWTIKKASRFYDQFETYECPHCHRKHELISGYRGLGNKSIKRQVTFFSRSRKSKNVILAKVVAAVLPIENGYRDCKLQTYIVGMMRLEIGKPTTYYVRNAYYYDGNFCHSFFWGEAGGENDIGRPWIRRKTIGYGLATEWENFGFAEYADYDALNRIIKTSAWKYCGKDEYYTSENQPRYACEIEKYLDLYSRFPQIEYLIKSGLANIVKAKLNGDTTKPAVFWRKCKNPKDMLRVKLSKEERKWIFELHQTGKDVSVNALNILTIQQQLKRRCTLSDAIAVESCYWLLHGNILNDLRFMDLHSLVAYCSRQLAKAREKDRDNPWKNVNVGTICRDYIDYYEEIKRLGYDLNDRTYIRPRDLYEAHRHTSELLRIRHEAKMKAMRQKELELQKAGLAKYVKNLQSYIFTDGTYLIRPLRTVDEFIREGSVNHNCVGTYITRCAQGHTAIMAIRKIDDPDTVFYTMEIQDNKIMQCRTKNNVPVAQGTAIDDFVKLYEKMILKPKQQLRREGA